MANMKLMIKENPFNPKLFQKMEKSKLKRAGIELTADLAVNVPFPKAELDRLNDLKGKIPALSGVDISKLPLDYTSQPPLSRGGLIAVAGDIIALASMKENGSIDKAALEGIVNDFQKLSSEKIDSEFLGLAIKKFQDDLKSLPECGSKQGIILENAKKNIDAFTKYVEDIEAVKKAMFDSGMADTSIYKKLKVDLEYLSDMNGFIMQSVRKIASMKETSETTVAMLEQTRDLKVKAIQNSDMRTALDKWMKIGKVVLGSVGVGAATFIAAKTELLGLLAFTGAPNLIFVGAVVLGIGAGFLIDYGIENRRANHAIRTIKKYKRKIDKVKEEAMQFAYRHLKVIGFKANKEAAIAGYLESLQGNVSDNFLAAAFRGDFERVRAIYQKQADTMLGTSIIKRVARWVQKLIPALNGERKSDRLISGEAHDADGLAPESNGAGTPSA